MRRITRCIILIICFSFLSPLSAQEVALKTNLVKDAMLSPNVGIEFGLAPKWSLDITGEVNAWKLSDGKRWKHWFVMPEARYWFCDRFAGHFLGIHVFGGQYNMGYWDTGYCFLNNHFKDLKDQRYQGWYVGAGIGYGYSWILSKHWNLEAEIGIGYAHSRYDVYGDCPGCEKKLNGDSKKIHNYVGPTKVAVNLVYSF